jgi:hypothetical protein
MMTKTTAFLVTGFFLTACLQLGCGSEYTITNRSSLTISDNSRVTAASLLPSGNKDPRVADHLALAQEVYGRQLDLLKERRNKVRSRRRTMDLASYCMLAATGVVAGSLALYASSAKTSDQSSNLKLAGGTAMGGVVLGTGFQIGALIQEDVATVDSKIQQLDSMYSNMLDEVRMLSSQPATELTGSLIGTKIENFINKALQINVKG